MFKGGEESVNGLFTLQFHLVFFPGGPVSVQRYEDVRGLHPPHASSSSDWSNWKEKEYAEGQDLYAEVGEVEEEQQQQQQQFAGYARVGNSHPPLLVPASEPAPYATTTLAMQNNNRALRTVVIKKHFYSFLGDM